MKLTRGYNTDIQYGPTIDNIYNYYNDSIFNLSSYISMTTRGIQLFNVPVSGLYKINCVGARGGYSFNSSGYGKGVKIELTTYLLKNTFLKCVIGQVGQNENSDPNSDKIGAGGGGCSFIYINTSDLIV